MSGSIRLFVPDDLVAGATLALTPAQAHYLAQVMRRAPGDTLRLFNGRDGEWEARIGALGRNRAEVAVATRLRAQAAQDGPWLAFALLKRDATDLVIRQATELGAGALLPVLTARTNAARVNEARLAAIATEAAEQCERLTIPAIHPPATLAALLAAWPAGRRLFAALERSGAPPPAPDGPCGLLIGPEGGFTQAELDLLRTHPLVTPTGLGPLVLRAETAAVAGLALLQALLQARARD
ncbi:MAG: 16S rRNA (uracil(1498)-N(3))-methyltransferase [Rhodospirillales bacterium]|nr:16S rRNA (uracil(1498)-N(3))-methyltransferase [Rhodospirillales bacterium]